MMPLCLTIVPILFYAWAVNSNTFCEMAIPSTTVIHRFEGKMNVPIKPKEEPHAVLFLWPGLNPYGGEGGLMQPVITYGQGVPAGNWGIAQWFSDCPGYCHDPYQVISEGILFIHNIYKSTIYHIQSFKQSGDTILFYMQYIETYKNGSQHWEMGWSSYNDPKTGSKFQVYREGGNVKSIWATEAEFYLNSSDPSNWNKLPASSFYVWDMFAFTDKNNASVKLEWTAHNGEPQPGNFVNCSLPVIEDPAGTILTFYNNDGCTTSGYSRAWNEACQSYCGCNNKDGTKKPECDYCCMVENGSCKRENGPSDYQPGKIQREFTEIHPGALVN